MQNHEPNLPSSMMPVLAPTMAIASAPGEAMVMRATYSATSLLRRAMLGLFLLITFTSVSAWLLHTSTNDQAQAGISRAP